VAKTAHPRPVKAAQLKRQREAKQKAFCLQNCLKLRTLALDCDRTITAKVRFLSHFSPALKKNQKNPTADSKIGTDTKYIKPFFVSFMISCFLLCFKKRTLLFVRWLVVSVDPVERLPGVFYVYTSGFVASEHRRSAFRPVGYQFYVYTPQTLLHQNIDGLHFVL